MNNSRKELIISALLTSPTIKEASKKCNVPEATIYKNLKNEEFNAMYKSAKADIINQATTYLQNTTIKAIQTIESIADDEEVNAQTRLYACRTLLEYNLRLTEKNDIIQRLEALENYNKETDI